MNLERLIPVSEWAGGNEHRITYLEEYIKRNIGTPENIDGVSRANDELCKLKTIFVTPPVVINPAFDWAAEWYPYFNSGVLSTRIEQLQSVSTSCKDDSRYSDSIKMWNGELMLLMVLRVYMHKYTAYVKGTCSKSLDSVTLSPNNCKTGAPVLDSTHRSFMEEDVRRMNYMVGNLSKYNETDERIASATSLIKAAVSYLEDYLSSLDDNL